MAINENVAAYYKMNEPVWDGTAGEVIDTMGVNDGTIVGTPTTTASGKLGRGGLFGLGDRN